MLQDSEDKKDEASPIIHDQKAEKRAASAPGSSDHDLIELNQQLPANNKKDGLFPEGDQADMKEQMVD